MFIDTTKKEKLLRPLQVVIGIVERKQTLPILSNILLEKNDGKLEFTATDLEIQITTTLVDELAKNSSESITVAGKKFLDILRILPDESTLSLESKENRVIVRSGKSRFSLQSLPAMDFPKLQDHRKGKSVVTLQQKKLKDLLNSVQYAMAQQDVRYYLNGVLIITESNQLRAVATDGHRLAYNSISVDGEFSKQEIIIPRKAVMELSRLLNDTEDTVELEFSSQQFKATFGGINLLTKVIDGKFPDYERVIPKYDNHLDMDRLKIQQALQRVSILANEKFRGVRFILTEKNLSIISSNSEQEEAQEEIETEYHGNAIDIGFNVNYLLDGINNIASKNIEFSFGDPNSSILITTKENEDFRYVVMPMRI